MSEQERRDERLKRWSSYATVAMLLSSGLCALALGWVAIQAVR